MANLPESLFVDPTVGYSGGASSHSTKPAEPKNLRSASMEQLVVLLGEPQFREDVLAILNKEVLSLYKMLSPSKLTMTDSNRVCNALALFQCIASHPETRMGLVRAKIPVYLYPFVKTSEKQRPFEYLKLTSLGVIGALVKVEDSNTPQVIHFLLETELFPLCLGCMENGNELTQTVATYIVSKILMQREGIHYCSVFAERFFVVGGLLASMVDKLPPEPPLQLLKHIISCFLSLAEVPRAHAHDALRRCFPARLTDPKFIRVAYEDSSTKPILEALLYEVSAGPWAKSEPAGDVGGPSKK